MVASVLPPAALPAPRPAMRLESLDGVRLLTAFGVLLYHYQGEFGLGLEAVIPGLKRVYLLVDLFFVLSGFVIAEVYHDRMSSLARYGSYLARRVGRIYPLHVLTLVAVLALGQSFVAAGIWSRLPNHMSPSGLPANILLLHGWGIEPDLYFNYPSWSVSAEMFQYLAFPLYLVVAHRLPTWALCLAFVGSVAAIAHFHLGWEPWSGFTVDGALRACPSFFAGVAISAMLRKRQTLPSVPWAAVYAFGLLLLASLASGVNDAVVILLDPVLILLVVMAERGSRDTWLRSRPMVLFGQASYSIYMFHIPVSVAAMGIGHYALGNTLGVNWALCLASTAVTLGLSLLSFRHFERPAQRMVTRLYAALCGLGVKAVPEGGSIR